MASTYLTKTFSSDTTAGRRKWTWSAWVKRSALSTESWLFHAYQDGNNENSIFFDTSDRLAFSIYEGASNSNGRLTTTRKFRDISAWYHIVVVWDSANSTAADRMIIYVNGERLTAYDTNTNGGSNHQTLINKSGVEHSIGRYGSGTYYFNGTMAHVHFTDGYAYAASDFGETDSTSGIWVPNASPSVTYGTNGFFLKFENSGAMGTDSSGNSNTFTVNGTMTQNEDTPSNNFPTFNILNPGNNQLTIQNGNLFVFNNSNNNWASTPATMGCTSGKWYWELKDEEDWGSTSDSTRRYGICDLNTIVSTLGTAADVRYSGSTSAYAYMNASGVRYNGGTISGTTSSHPTFQKDDFIMVAMDLDNNKLYFGKNGTWLDSGDPTSGASGTGSVADISSTATWAPYVETKYGSDNVSINFGQGYFKTTSAGSNTDANGEGKFKYTVPSGYYAICTKNIKEFG